MREEEDPAGQGGEEIEFSEENLRAAIAWPWVRAALYEAWTASQSGDRARLGN